jgi:hypothetical protein
VRPPTPQELKATTVLKFGMEEASAKIRIGPPGDDDADYALPVWAGVLPLALHFGAPEADPRLRQDVAAPPYLTDRGRDVRRAGEEPK